MNGGFSSASFAVASFSVAAFSFDSETTPEPPPAATGGGGFGRLERRYERKKTRKRELEYPQQDTPPEPFNKIMRKAIQQVKLIQPKAKQIIYNDDDDDEEDYLLLM